MGKRILVTGATGFLGGGVARRLLTEGHDVLGTGRSLVKGAQLKADGVEFQAAELSHAPAVRELCKDRDIVIHCAALSSPWGSLEDFQAANVDATRNILDAVKEWGAERLVHISSPSVYCCDEDQFDIPEDHPFTTTPLNYYIKSKIEAEELVASSEVPYIILRPRGLFGPGDPSIFPRLIDRMVNRKLPIVGRGDNIVDITYIDNVVHATCLAALTENHDALGGNYNITNGESVELWSFINALADKLELPRPTRHVPYRLLYGIGFILEGVHRVFFPEREPRITRYGVVVLGRSTTLNIDKAKQELGYEPIVGVLEGLDRYVEWWGNQRTP